LDRDGIIRNWNKGAEKIKGYKEEEIVGNHFRIFYPARDQADRLPEKLMEEAVVNGKAIHEGWRIRKDGSAFWGSIVITAMHDEAQGVIGFSKVTRDLTERKTAEDKLFQYARQLEGQNKELQQFAYAAAHDMKEPLRKIQFYTSAVLEEGGSMEQEREQTYLRRSAEAAKRMQRLIEDLLAFTKVAEPVEKFEPVDLNAMMDEVRLFYQDITNPLNVIIISEELRPVKGIPFQIRQLLLNLIGNSLKYHHPTRSPRIEVTGVQVMETDARAGDTSEFYKLSIKDNGIGFEQTHAEKIFEIFERLHGREQYSGSGIGLAICKKIMENHKGFIRASGFPDGGAVFDLYFPVL
jgi:PAS domain S-box-containing protein